MANKSVLLTEGGLNELREKLNYLKSVRRLEVADRLKAAIALGDLSENSEYDDAKNEQSFLEGEIAEHAIVQLGIVALQQLCPGQAVMEGVPVELDLRQLLLGKLLPLLAGAVVRP